MQRLWAPWREGYISKVATKKMVCVFCKILSQQQDEKNLIFIRQSHAYAVMNLYPYSNGHCLIIPNRHVADISQLTSSEYAQLMKLLLTTKNLLEKAFKPQGFNIGINLCPVAGAGIPKHVHIHIVPRWSGDHNFMPVIGDTRVLSQSLSAMYQKIVYANQKRHRGTRK